MNMEELRKEIDKIDDEIINLLGKRKNLVKIIAGLKKESNKPTEDKSREQQIIERLKELSKKYSLDENFVAALYQVILKNSKEEQEKWK
tara:strand:+ start:20489 stop:20755 length:267 start_codon:yes stop_codon:yes gene_type:complete